MALHPQVKALLDEFNAEPAKSPWERDVKDVRDEFDSFFATLASPGPDVGRVEDRTIDGPYRPIPIRIYWPEGADERHRLPVYINFHGSGFVVLNIDSFDHVCRILCRDAECIVVAVDYCKSPEYKFPKPAEEAWASFLWISGHCKELGGDPERIAVGGDSAGGCLATVVAQRAQRQGGPKIVFQLLVYPLTDTKVDTESYRDFADGYMLTAESMKWYFHCYFNDDSERAHPWAAPLNTLNLEGMPPALVITAGFDPLFSEGKAYAERLAAASVPTQFVNYEGGVHGFWTATKRLDIAHQAHAVAASALRKAFGAAEVGHGQ